MIQSSRSPLLCKHADRIGLQLVKLFIQNTFLSPYEEIANLLSAGQLKGYELSDLAQSKTICM